MIRNDGGRHAHRIRKTEEQRCQTESGLRVGNPQHGRSIAGTDVGHSAVETPTACHIGVIDQVLLGSLEFEASLDIVAALGPVHDIRELEKVVNLVVAGIAAEALHLTVAGAQDWETVVENGREAELLEVVVRQLRVLLAPHDTAAAEAQTELIDFVAAPSVGIVECEVGSRAGVGGDLFDQSTHEVTLAVHRDLRHTEGHAVGLSDELV